MDSQLICTHRKDDTKDHVGYHLNLPGYPSPFARADPSPLRTGRGRKSQIDRLANRDRLLLHRVRLSRPIASIARNAGWFPHLVIISELALLGSARDTVARPREAACEVGPAKA